ncbi:MAG: PAS domain S-box protein, partial [Myxococcales bacterium]|nr:PAS domain S-box protein [Myxococcales bacterium]
MPQKERTSLLTQTKTRGPKQLTKLLFESIQRADQAFALLDPNGTLIFANKAWESFTHQYKGISVRIGDNYLDLCQRLSPQVAYAGQAYQALTNLYDEKKEHDSFESDPSTTQSLSKFTSQFWRSPLGEQPYITISHKTTAPQTQAPTSHPSKAEKKEGIFHLFFSAFQVSPNPIMITDTQGYIKWVNPAWSEITGYEPQEVLGKTPSFLSSGKQNSQHYKRLWKKLLQGESWEGEFHNRRKDGTLYDAKTTITPIKDEKKHLTHFVSIQQDITHQRHIENELFQSKERFDRAMKATSEGLWDIDLQTKEIYLSERFEELLGYPQDEIPRDITKLVDFIHKADTQRFIQS